MGLARMKSCMQQVGYAVPRRTFIYCITKIAEYLPTGVVTFKDMYAIHKVLPSNCVRPGKSRYIIPRQGLRPRGRNNYNPTIGRRSYLNIRPVIPLTRWKAVTKIDGILLETIDPIIANPNPDNPTLADSTR